MTATHLTEAWTRDRILQGLPEGSGYLTHIRPDDTALTVQLNTGHTITERILRPALRPSLIVQIDTFIADLRDEHKAKLERPHWHDDALPAEAPQ